MVPARTSRAWERYACVAGILFVIPLFTLLINYRERVFIDIYQINDVEGLI